MELKTECHHLRIVYFSPRTTMTRRDERVLPEIPMGSMIPGQIGQCAFCDIVLFVPDSTQLDRVPLFAL